MLTRRLTSRLTVIYVGFCDYGTDTDKTSFPTPLFPTPLSSTILREMDGDVGSTSNEVTHDRPQHTERMRL